MQGIAFTAAMHQVVAESRGHATSDIEESLDREIGELADQPADETLGDLAFPAIALSMGVPGLLREFEPIEIEADA